ncbi:hypothetical protein COCCADRAFT_83261 [Bipolaris zeicola 26-R-13]|uniref:Uncharacterized protein n=1 Tax=Cochliobolus carbonum (strain 26-R-13) TaxID=930089 RepID=W6YFV5_COCC2|nr:uncharacterized protein COCCADRAFT_83261 [Bipolaris zeicola 26-R-13]EUC38362.1 hypothetical protein COCCADRAFT_83261 [Bipolaris zeicola 26-R-13]
MRQLPPASPSYHNEVSDCEKCLRLANLEKFNGLVCYILRTTRKKLRKVSSIADWKNATQRIFRPYSPHSVNNIAPGLPPCRRIRTRRASLMPLTLVRQNELHPAYLPSSNKASHDRVIQAACHKFFLHYIKLNGKYVEHHALHHSSL